MTAFEISGILWVWTPNPPAKASWYFLTIDPQTAAEIRYEALGRTRGFGSIRVSATIGETIWQTSIFPHKESGGFILPVKADVRRAEGIGEGHSVKVRLEI